MRRSALLMFTIPALIVGACVQPKNQIRADSWNVKLNVQCKPNGVVRVNIDPFVSYVDTTARKTARWSLGNDPDAVDFVTIEPRAGGDWPFEGTRVQVSKGGQAESGRVKSGVTLRQAYKYDIKATCVIDGRNRPILIDPDMIIID